MAQTTTTNHLIAQKITGIGFQPTSQAGSVSQLEDIISGIIGFITIVAAIFFVFQIIFAGYGFLSAQGDEKKIETSRKKITDGILGLTIVVVAFGLTAFISSMLGLNNILNLGTFFNNR
ncbi:MAG: hypothetical protein KIH89_002450 [Candidatus Shapirobacteria bacterium]|nr:hypothetical protein [Candidatus Shapirobacteria bacterium]